MRKIKQISALGAALVFSAGFVWNMAHATPSGFQRLSVSTAGVEANNDMGGVSFSKDGKFAVFSTIASNLVSGDTNSNYDVFLRDIANNTTIRVSTDSSGAEANGLSSGARVSYNGAYVVFSSGATNLVSGDTNNRGDIFRKHVQTGAIEIVNKTAAGTLGNDFNSSFDVSADGRYVAFISNSTNLVAGISSPSPYHLYLKDMNTGEIQLLDLNTSGNPSNNSAYGISLSCDGGMVAFSSDATDLVSGDTNAKRDIFLQSLVGNDHVSQSVTTQGNDFSQYPDLSCDGNVVAFGSRASNLVVGDANGNDDFFIYDRMSNEYTLVSLKPDGSQSSSLSLGSIPTLSGNNKLVAFSTAASLVAADGNASDDVYIRDIENGTTDLASLNTTSQAAGTAQSPFLSNDGKKIVFKSAHANIVSGDTNGGSDIFLANTGF
jgi:hypothetical protein